MLFLGSNTRRLMVASMRVTCHHQIPVIDDLSHPKIESMSSVLRAGSRHRLQHARRAIKRVLVEEIWNRVGKSLIR